MNSFNTKSDIYLAYMRSMSNFILFSVKMAKLNCLLSAQRIVVVDRGLFLK